MSRELKLRRRTEGRNRLVKPLTMLCLQECHFVVTCVLPACAEAVQPDAAWRQEGRAAAAVGGLQAEQTPVPAPALPEDRGGS